MLPPRQSGVLELTALPPRRSETSKEAYDIFSCEEVVIPPYGTRGVRTGIVLELSKGNYALIGETTPLSYCTAGKQVVDAENKTTLKVAIHNHGDTEVRISPGQAIASMVAKQLKGKVRKALRHIEGSEILHLLDDASEQLEDNEPPVKERMSPETADEAAESVPPLQTASKEQALNSGTST